MINCQATTSLNIHGQISQDQAKFYKSAIVRSMYNLDKILSQCVDEDWSTHAQCNNVIKRVTNLSLVVFFCTIIDWF